MGVLDALDQSFGVSGGFGASASLAGIAGSSSSAASQRVSEALMKARLRQMEALDDDDDGATGVLSLLASPGKSNSARDFSLRYNDDAPIRSIDIGGADQDQKLAEFVTSSIDNLSHDIDVKTAMQELNLRNARDILPGLEVRLLGHQCIGVAWMVRMEKSDKRGGILADDMGLGKTVQMIATMVVNTPEPDEESKTTLIVVPAALMEQWKEEIETKTTDQMFRAHIHHGRDKLKKLSQVKRTDVIITSYQTLCSEFSAPKNVEPADEAEWIWKNGGILARTKFYRVIADEAQFIRNRSTKSSIALALVRAKYRWSLTGTPITNSLADIYGLLRFGQFRPYNDWVSFLEHVVKVQSSDAPLAGSRAQVILRPLILRRTKESTLEGEPILKLPPKEIELVSLKFSEEERNVYDSFERSSKTTINRFIRENTLVKHHAYVLVMILRLRQLCCHPNLILAKSDAFDDPTAMMKGEADQEIARARKSLGPAWVVQVQKMFLEQALAQEDLTSADDENDAYAPDCPVCQEAYTEANARILPCKHEMCAECAENAKNAPISHDGIFGLGNEQQNLAVERAFEEAEAKGYRPCPTCRTMVDLSPDKIYKSVAFCPSDKEVREYRRSQRRTKQTKLHFISRSPSPAMSITSDLSDSDDDLPEFPFTQPTKKEKENDKVSGKGKRKVDDDDDSDIEFTGMTPSRKKRSLDAKRRGSPMDDSDAEVVAMTPSRKGKGKSKDSLPSTPSKKEAENEAGPSEAVFATWKRGDDDMEPSTKMMALIGYLKEWDSLGEKTICYSQWTSMLDLIEILLSRHGIRSLRFDGKMDRRARDQAITNFKRLGGPKIMLISTRCGSVGLNLVMANRIVNMDLSWNYAAESQAYDRCHRIGQDKPVFVKRLVVENTIEERMLRLQDVKVGLAEAALGEGTGAKLHKLSVKDIQYLFGIAPAGKNSGDRGTNGRQNRGGITPQSSP
ncbi:hypothetical protein FA15DRAFT_727203 [Coprinopsis marcescibilis]|uniref:Uncharacterized protein n=1 Tax=Coprinopsis marcescibilis TaxID=230819 RepID=A0A5C3L3M9_COPMA|nr:hypothetical protein FA15DRAFT_727203 [Coprinopsis marcescibilis]